MDRTRLVLRSLLATMTIAMIFVTTASAADGPAPCRVRNPGQHTHGRSLVRMIERAVDGDHLEVSGLCRGAVVIRRDLVIRGRDDGAVLSGEERARVVMVTREAKVTLRALTIARGGDVEEGAGIHNRGALTLVDSIVRRNVASGRGGAIHNRRRLNMTRTTVFASSADDNGGGIWNRGTLFVRDSIISNVTGLNGGGIWNGGTARLTDTSVDHNTGTEGGGIYNDPGATIELIRTKVFSNVAISGGGIRNRDGTVAVDGTSSVTDNVPDDCVGTPAC